MKNLLNSWKCRNLSLTSKVTIINTLALSTLLYLASVIRVPSMVFKEVKHIVVEGKTSKIAYVVLIQQTEEGCLQLVDFEDKVKSLKVTWVKCLTKDRQERWMASPTVFYKTQNISQHFLFNQNKIKMEPKFYEDIHNYWSELQGVEKTKVDTILNKIIWNNQFITIQNMPFRRQKWTQHDIMYIKDLLSNNSNILSHQEINDKYNVGCNVLNILQLRQSKRLFMEQM